MLDIIKTRDESTADLAKKLGFSGVLVVGKDIEIIKTANKADVRRLVLKARKKFPLVCMLGSSDEVNRAVIEAKVDVLLSPEFSREHEKDFMEYRNSGLSTVICKLASQNKVAVGINFDDILRADESYRVTLLGRIIQNIKLCRKYKVNILLASFATSPFEMRAVHDLHALAEVLGMTPQQAKKSLNLAASIIKKNQEKNEIEGIKILD